MLIHNQMGVTNQLRHIQACVPVMATQKIIKAAKAQGLNPKLINLLELKNLNAILKHKIYLFSHPNKKKVNYPN